MKTIFSEDHRLQDGKAELIDGKLLPCFEMPRRAEIVLARVREQKLGEVLPPRDFGLDPVRRARAPGGGPRPGGSVPSRAPAGAGGGGALAAYAARRLCGGAPGWPGTEPVSIDGQLSHYSFDAGTPITAGTWRAVTASVNVAL